jgi:hypothetical protein
MPANFAVVPIAEEIIITCDYDQTGLLYIDMWDNHTLAWAIDTTGADPAMPVIVGKMPRSPPDTAPVVSPAWIETIADQAIVPDQWRGTLTALFDWLATNNGATRQLRGNFSYVGPMNAWNAWAQDNPDKVWPGP